MLENRSAGSHFAGRVAMETPGVVRANLLYFPGWRVTIDGAPVEPRIAPPYGLMDIDLPAGEHVVALRMGATQERMVGTVISWVTLLALMGFAIASLVVRSRSAAQNES